MSSVTISVKGHEKYVYKVKVIISQRSLKGCQMSNDQHWKNYPKQFESLHFLFLNSLLSKNYFKALSVCLCCVSDLSYNSTYLQVIL